MRLWKASAIALLALVSFAPLASARGRVAVRSSYYRVYYGPVWYPGFYGGYNPWYGPWYGPAYRPGPETGNVKIDAEHKGDSIYVDGGFAGRTGELKKFPLRAGNHTIELRDLEGHTFYQEQVHVIAGKTLKIRAVFPG